MHATQVRDAGKPKVVTILRPVSLSTTSTSVLNELRSPDRPSTPNRVCQEISVFSPDTPVRHRRSTSTYSRKSLRPASLTPQRYRRCSFATPQRSSYEHSQSIRSSLALSLNQSQDTSTTKFSTYTTTSPMRTPPAVPWPTSEVTAWSGCRKLEGILEAVSQAIDSFPNGMLRLDLTYNPCSTNSIFPRRHAH